MKKYAGFLILLSGILWGVVGIFVKQLNALGFSSIHISAIRWILSAVLLPLCLFISDRDKLKIKLSDIPVFICTGIVCILLCSTLYFITIPLMGMSAANTMMYTSPIWVMLISVIFFREKMTPSKLISLILAVIGCVFVTGMLSLDKISFNPIGIITGLLSGFFYGLYSIVGKSVLKKYEPITVTAYTVIFAALGSLLLLNPTYTFPLMVKNPDFLIPALIIAVFCSVMPYGLYTIGLKYENATRASILACIEPVTATVCGIFIGHEAADAFQLLGMLLILLSIIIPSLSKN